MSRQARNRFGTSVFFVVLVQLSFWNGGGCPATGSSTPTADGNSTGTDTAGTSTAAGGTSAGGQTGGTGGSQGGDTSETGGTGETGDPNSGSGTGSDTGSGAGDNTGSGSDPNATDPNTAGFTTAVIIHKAAGGFAADPKYGIPDASYFNTSGSIQTSVRIPRVTKDGNRIWFVTGDGNGFVEPQLFCMNTDGSGLEEIPLPADPNLYRAPEELAPSANGSVCAIRMETGGGTDFSQTVVLLATLAAKTVTTVFDARTITGGKDDFKDVQITDDGATVYFRCDATGNIYAVPASGGSLATVATIGDFPRTASTPRGLNHFRINGDASALLANVWYYGPNNTYPSDIYLKTPSGVTALTNTGDAPQTHSYEYLGVSDDSRYVVYRRLFSSESRYRSYVLDRASSVMTTLETGASSSPLLLDSGGTTIFTWHATGRYYGGTDQLPALNTLNGSSALQLTETWAGRTGFSPDFTSMSSGADVLVGTWANGGFGDPVRLYIWFPNDTSYRTGPSITAVSFKLDQTAGTLTTRATVSGTTSDVGILFLYDNFESFYQLEDSADPFMGERFGQGMSATDTTGVYEHTADFAGFTLDSLYRVRVIVADNTAKNYAYVDFRPLPITAETVDINADGVAD